MHGLHVTVIIVGEQEQFMVYGLQFIIVGEQEQFMIMSMNQPRTSLQNNFVL